MKAFLFLILLILVTASQASNPKLYVIKAKANTPAERTRLIDLGLAIDLVYSDSVAGIGDGELVHKLRKNGVSLEAIPDFTGTRGFPTRDLAFHDYQGLNNELAKLVSTYPNLVTQFSIGKSKEGRDIFGVRISSNPNKDSLPTTLFVGCHHSREHLSVEMPLKLAQYLTAQYSADSRIRGLLDTREVWIVPMLNPDGAEYDITGGQYHYWRKNRARNSNGSSGVDLNRNYAKGWGGPGASGNMNDETYRGPSAFSEPETQALRDFVKSRRLTGTMLSFHTFSELVLWPWGHKYDVVANDDDRKAFESMGRKMASWNHYKPQKASALYLASGDMMDWAYDELKIFAFTIELSPNGSFGMNGFYPGASYIDPVFKANLEPSLYLIERAENPYADIF